MFGSYDPLRRRGPDVKRGENHPPFVGHWLAVSQANEEKLRAAYESAARTGGRIRLRFQTGDECRGPAAERTIAIRGSGEEVTMPKGGGGRGGEYTKRGR